MALPHKIKIYSATFAASSLYVLKPIKVIVWTVCKGMDNKPDELHVSSFVPDTGRIYFTATELLGSGFGEC
jgi:hypothetical protein